MKIAVIAPDVHVARSWVAKNHLALAGCHIDTMGARMAPLSLRGQTYDRVYVVRTGPHSAMEVTPQLADQISITLVAVGGESLVVSHNDYLQPVITATCGRDGCGAVPKVVVVNRAGETQARTAACPTDAAQFVGAATERIEPLIVGRSIF